MIPRPSSRSASPLSPNGYHLPPQLLAGAPEYPPGSFETDPLAEGRSPSRQGRKGLIASGSSPTRRASYDGGSASQGGYDERSSGSQQRNWNSQLPYPSTHAPSAYSNTHPEQSYHPHPSYDQPVATPLPRAPDQIALAQQYHEQLVAFYFEHAMKRIPAQVSNVLQHRAREEALYWVRQKELEMEAYHQQQSQFAHPPPPLPPPLHGTPPHHYSWHPPPPVDQFASPVPILSSPSTTHPPPHLPSLPSYPSLPPLPTIPTKFSTPTNPLVRAVSLGPTSPARAPPLPVTPGPTGLVRSASANSPQGSPGSGGGGRKDMGSIPAFVSDSSSHQSELDDKLKGLDLSDSASVNTMIGSVAPLISAPSIPSFSFGDDQDDGPSIAIFSSPALPLKQRLHPRHDPSHPSHPLYHPASTLITLSSSLAEDMICPGCNSLIIGRAMLALDKRWHPSCFVCEVEDCGVLLEHVMFGENEGKAYCMVHHEELFADKCYQCKTPIAETDFVTVDDARLLPPGRRTYHALHFFCADCGDPFVNPSSLAISAFTVNKGFAYCEKCDVRLFKERCSACKKGIAGDFLEALGGIWHEECFGCCICHKPFANGSYLVRDDEEEGVDKPYCTECYHVRARAV